MTDEFVTQLWSGTIGAVVGAVFGVASAIFVLHFTTRIQREQSEEALRSQRDQARQEREIGVVSGLLQNLTAI